jgi:hypothetical protein
MKTDLIPDERNRLTGLEAIIQTGLRTFTEVGNALAEIRDSRLYRETHPNFAAYCRERWKISPQHAHRLAKASEVAENLEMEPIGSKPETEAQVRPLTRLPPEERAPAWQEAVEEAKGEQPTGRQVEEVVTRRQDRKPAETVQVTRIPSPVDDPGPDHVSDLRDAIGVRVPLGLMPVFRLSDELESVSRAWGKEAGRIETLFAGSSGIGELTVDAIKGRIKELQSVLRLGRPYTLCPACDPGMPCRRCNGTGWLTKVGYDSLTPTLKLKLDMLK